MSVWSNRTNAIKVTARRELLSTLYGLGLYVVLFVIFLLTAYGSIRVSLLNVVNNGLEALPTRLHRHSISRSSGRYVSRTVFSYRYLASVSKEHWKCYSTDRSTRYPTFQASIFSKS